MGANFSLAKAFEQLVPRAKQILLVGLDHSGKTTITYNLKLHEAVLTIPTIGCNAETIQHENKKLIMYDLGGNAHLRSIWKEYYLEADAIIFVIDSSDRERLKEAKYELHSIFSNCSNSNKFHAHHKRQTPLLILANKQDVEGCLTPEEIAKGLELDQLNGFFGDKISSDGDSNSNKISQSVVDTSSNNNSEIKSIDKNNGRSISISSSSSSSTSSSSSISRDSNVNTGNGASDGTSTVNSNGSNSSGNGSGSSISSSSSSTNIDGNVCSTTKPRSSSGKNPYIFRYHIQPCIAMNGSGLQEGLKWLSKMLK